MVDEFTVAPSGGQFNLPLVASTAYDLIIPDQTPRSWHDPVELTSHQEDATLRISFISGELALKDTGVHIERVDGDALPPCVTQIDSDALVWRVDPIDKSPGRLTTFVVTLDIDMPETVFLSQARRLLLVSEAAEIKDITDDECCSPGNPLIIGRHYRFGYVALVKTDPAAN